MLQYLPGLSAGMPWPVAAYASGCANLYTIISGLTETTVEGNRRTLYVVSDNINCSFLNTDYILCSCIIAEGYILYSGKLSRETDQ